MPEYPPPATPEQMWTYPTRELTARPPDTPSATDYTATRAAKLDEIPTREADTEGTADFLTTETYPKTVIMVTKELGVHFFLEGWLDLSDLVAGESVKVTYETSNVTPVSYKKYEEVTYSGAQAKPQIYLKTHVGKYGLRISITMDTAPAADRSFPFQFFSRRIG